MHDILLPQGTLAGDHDRAVLIGRVWIEGQGPTPVRILGDHVHDLSGVAATC